jgi:LPS export ABC transporter protein LptC
MDFFREGEYFSTLVSDSGIANLQTNDVFVWGDVVVTTSDGRRLRTSELHYTNSDGLIRNEVFNVFDRGQDVITGIGLEATPDLDYIEIKRDVAAEVSDEAAAQAGGGERSREPGGSP